MLDWEGMLASTVFLPRCNFRCPFCQNGDLVLHPERLETVPFSTVYEFIEEREGWIEGVCITGGEPCLHEELPNFCSELKSRGVGVKLDTNGSFPTMLRRLISDELIDYVAMDLKAPFEQNAYRVASGCNQRDVVDLVETGMNILRESGIDYEFRTTVVPMMHGPEEVAQIAERLRSEEKFILQHFRPDSTLDPRFSELKPFTESDMDQMLNEARKHVPGAKVRGAPAAME